MSKITDKEIDKLFKEASKTLRKRMSEAAKEKNKNGEPLELDIKIDLANEGSPSGDYVALYQCYVICIDIGGDRICYRFCW